VIAVLLLALVFIVFIEVDVAALAAGAELGVEMWFFLLYLSKRAERT